ncbi:hypothetical protein [Nocardioides sp. KR10-350]|uniref:hypothetical protein n=1 Tax=Nocardioides cheoyonin TaxID=3156615 RepID=UPI0032B5C0B2
MQLIEARRHARDTRAARPSLAAALHDARASLPAAPGHGPRDLARALPSSGPTLPA